MIKRLYALTLLLALFAMSALAQSSMTDEQVMQFVVKEQKAGTSQNQIVTKLIQRGVDITQIRRIKARYERQLKDKGLGQVADQAVDNAEARMRKNNGDPKENTTKRISKRSTYQRTYDETDEDFVAFQKELNTFAPDSTLMMLEEEKEEEPARKVFGRDIFNKKNLSFEPNMNIATPQNYRLGPGDAVIVDVFGASQKTFTATVSPDGDINIEGYGPVQVSGMTVAQANAHLRSQLGARYRSSQVRLTVGQTKTIMVNVMGEVNAPGTYTLSAFASVFHALYMAGGPNDLGTLRNIKVYRSNKLVTTVDVYDYMLNGKLTGNVRLADNDVIVVGPYDCLVNITGKVKRPMFYEMKKNESVGTLLKYAGGFTGDAYKNAVRLIRKTGKEFSIHNVEEFKFNDFQLNDEDSVSVDSIIQRFSNMVEVKGAVFRPGMYEVGADINSVRTLIQHADGVREDAFTAHAVMHRQREDRTKEVIQVDIDGIMSGRVADIPVQNNDVLFIPSLSDVQENQTITIHGEVWQPGIYEYAANETIEDFVLQAGGLKETASMVKVDVSRRIVNPKATEPGEEVAKTFSFALKDGFVIDGEPGFKLEPFDEVYVRKSPGTYEQQNIRVEGEVMFDGTYTLSKKNERLSDAIKAAGGLNDMAYSKGARLERRITDDERLRMQTVMKMLKSQSGESDSLDVTKLDLGNTYYVGIELDKALENPGCDDDIVLREGDRLIIPQYNGTVKISGDVMYPNTVAFMKGKKASYYIDQAGGFGHRAKKSHTYIIYMNGKVAKVGHDAKPAPGCEIIVPSKPKRDGRTLAEILTIGTSVASIATMIATLANILK